MSKFPRASAGEIPGSPDFNRADTHNTLMRVGKDYQSGKLTNPVPGQLPGRPYDVYVLNQTGGALNPFMVVGCEKMAGGQIYQDDRYPAEIVGQTVVLGQVFEFGKHEHRIAVVGDNVDENGYVGAYTTGLMWVAVQGDGQKIQFVKPNGTRWERTPGGGWKVLAQSKNLQDQGWQWCLIQLEQGANHDHVIMQAIENIMPAQQGAPPGVTGDPCLTPTEGRGRQMIFEEGKMVPHKVEDQDQIESVINLTTRTIERNQLFACMRDMFHDLHVVEVFEYCFDEESSGSVEPCCWEYETVFGHMRNIEVEVGDEVSVGQKIGEISDVGDPGDPHLHYEVRFNADDPLSGASINIDREHNWRRLGERAPGTAPVDPQVPECAQEWALQQIRGSYPVALGDCDWVEFLGSPQHDGPSYYAKDLYCGYGSGGIDGGKTGGQDVLSFGKAVRSVVIYSDKGREQDEESDGAVIIRHYCDESGSLPPSSSSSSSKSESSSEPPTGGCYLTETAVFCEGTTIKVLQRRVWLYMEWGRIRCDFEPWQLVHECDVCDLWRQCRQDAGFPCSYEPCGYTAVDNGGNLEWESAKDCEDTDGCVCPWPEYEPSEVGEGYAAVCGDYENPDGEPIPGGEVGRDPIVDVTLNSAMTPSDEFVIATVLEDQDPGTSSASPPSLSASTSAGALYIPPLQTNVPLGPGWHVRVMNLRTPGANYKYNLPAGTIVKAQMRANGTFDIMDDSDPWSEEIGNDGTTGTSETVSSGQWYMPYQASGVRSPF